MRLTHDEVILLHRERGKVSLHEDYIHEPRTAAGEFWHRWFHMRHGIVGSYERTLDEFRDTEYGKHLIALLTAHRLENS